MYKQMIVLVAAALTLTVSLAAQSKTVQGKEVSTTATIEGIEAGTRQLYVKKADGTNDVVYVPTEIKRFDSLKVGQKITVRYYENVVLRMATPGAAPIDSSSRSVTPAAGTSRHGGAAADGHRDHLRHRSQTPERQLHGSARLELHHPRPGQGAVVEVQGGRQGRHHLDRGDAGVRGRREVGEWRAEENGL